MKRKIIVYSILFAVVSLVAILSYVFRREDSNRYGESANAMEKMPQVQQDDVATIVVSDQRNPKVILKKESGQWVVYSDKKQPVVATPSKILQLLDNLNRARLVREINATPEEQEQLRLAGKQAKDWRNGGTDVIFFDKGHKQLLSISLGRLHSSLENVPDGRFVKVKDEHGKSRFFLTSERFDQIIPTVGNWMARVALPIDSCVILNIEFNFLKPDKKTLWQVRPGGTNYKVTIPQEQKFDFGILSKQLKLLNDGFTRDVAEDDVAFQATCELKLTLSNGLKYHLLMQESEEDDMQKLCKVEVEFDKTLIQQNEGETDEETKKRAENALKLAKSLNGYWGGRIFVLQPDVTYLLEQIPGKTQKYRTRTK